MSFYYRLGFFGSKMPSVWSEMILVEEECTELVVGWYLDAALLISY